MAILLSAMMPTISHAMAASQDAGSWTTAVCSASGTKFIPSPFAQPADNNTDSERMAMQHCPYCLAHADSVALIAHDAAPLAPADLSYVLPRLFYVSPSPLFAWAAANPRAPPTQA